MGWTAMHVLLLGCLASVPAVSSAQPVSPAAEIIDLRAELVAANARIEAQERRLRALEARLSGAEKVAPGPEAPLVPSIDVARARALTAPGGASAIQAPAIETVGEAPVELEQPAVAVLGDQGSVITRPGQLTAEFGLEYARADRNRALFRGIELPEAVLIGVFDINESRQDVLTAAASLRYGLSSRFELGVRVPYVYRAVVSVLAPVVGSAPIDQGAISDDSADGSGIGDVELSFRYQLTKAAVGRPFLIGNLQVVAPTGSNPFELPRDELGRALESATGAGFWGISPSVTDILPTDPAVLFGTLGYTHNFAENVDTIIAGNRLVRVKPGDSIAASAGIGLSLNQRTSLNLGYAHTWAFGTQTRIQLMEPPPGDDGLRSRVARDLQLGRFLFGVTYRVTDRTSVNWSVEIGATDDATDLRTVLRIPLVILAGR